MGVEAAFTHRENFVRASSRNWTSDKAEPVPLDAPGLEKVSLVSVHQTGLSRSQSHKRGGGGRESRNIPGGRMSLG